MGEHTLPWSPRRRLGVWLPLAWLAAMACCAVAAPWLPLQSPVRMDWDQLAAPPGFTAADGANGAAGTAHHWLGTDTMGRDLLSRAVHGARVSLTVGLIAPLIGLVIGGFLGMLAGYHRGRIESLIVGTMDVILAFPGLVLLLAVAFYLGAGLSTLIPALGFLTIPAFCRVARAQTLSLARRDFVTAARSLGATDLAVLLRELLPNVVVHLLVYGLLIMAVMVVVEGVMSFLGLGVPPPTPSWGGMIAEGREVLDEAPHICLVPAVFLFLTVLSLNLLGDSLRGWARARRGVG